MSAQSTEKLAKFACASYQNGSDVATWARANAEEGSAPWISPLFVSAEEDCLCFIVRCSSQFELAPEILSKLSFIVSIPIQMKLEPNVLEMIDAFSEDSAQPASVMNTFSPGSPLLAQGAEQELDIDLTISYYSNATTIYTSSASDGDGDGDSFVDDHASRSAASVSHLRAYSTASLSSFYWEESSTSGEDFNNSVSTNVERWKQFNDALDVQSVSTTTPQENSDPCGFDKLESFGVDGDVIVPLNSFLSPCNARKAGACLAFLVSEFAADPLVAHLSLTPRPTLLNYRARSIQQVTHTCMLCLRMVMLSRCHAVHIPRIVCAFIHHYLHTTLNCAQS